MNKFSRVYLVMVLPVLVFGFGGTTRGNETAKEKLNSPTEAGKEFELPQRQKNDGSSKKSTLDYSLGETGIKLGIVVGIFLVIVILLSKKQEKQSLPREAIEVLGRIPVSSKQSVQLIRFGQKLVLVESSQNGLKPISEITDPAEVNQMLDLIRPRLN